MLSKPNMSRERRRSGKLKATAFTIFLARQFLTLFSIYYWNSDIPSSIIPGLQCWYCNPSQAPYGILWYIVSYLGIFPLASTTGFVAYVNTIDFIVMHRITRFQLTSIIYQFFSVWIWLQAPYDLPILWLTALGLWFWPLALLGPLAKLPVGAPIQVWNFLLSKPYNVNDYQYYIFMGIVFVAVLAQRISKSVKKRKLLNTMNYLSGNLCLLLDHLQETLDWSPPDSSSSCGSPLYGEENRKNDDGTAQRFPRPFTLNMRLENCSIPKKRE
jgi:hypothetical protein